MADHTRTMEAPSSDGAADPTLSLKLAETEQLLAQAREALDAAERKHSIERELWAQGALDLETAALLTSATVAGMSTPDVRSAVADLKRRKPFLFRVAAGSGGAMSGHAEAPGALDQAASDARESGDRRALLRYLRLKRGA
jgi:hypothetical protein